MWSPRLRARSLTRVRLSIKDATRDEPEPPVITAAWCVVAIAAAWVFFGHLGYPAAMAALARWAPRPFKTAPGDPSLTVVIAVHNGAASLAAKLEGTLALAYPRPVQILVASDGSTDGTNEIAAGFADRGVTLIRNTRQGKEAAMAHAIVQATGDVVVFTDLSATIDPNGLQSIVEPFSDPAVGCVACEERTTGRALDGTFLSLVTQLRRWESAAGSLVGLGGPFFAVRRELCSPWPHDLASDMRIALEAGRRGFRAVSYPPATAVYAGTTEPAMEWYRRLRMSQRGIAVLAAYRDLLHPRHSRLALALWGHKVARFTGGIALLALLLGSAGLAAETTVGRLLLGGQALFYGVGLAGLAMPALTRVAPLRASSFFVLAHAGATVALWRHLRGHRRVLWTPTERPPGGPPDRAGSVWGAST